MLKLIDQLLAFPNDKDDAPDALEGGIYYINQKKKRGGKSTHKAGKYIKSSSRAA
jgi:hypothetical protein